jgi:hypothetical protein
MTAEGKPICPRSYRRFGCRLHETAECLGCHKVTVRRRLRPAEQRAV